MTVQEAIDAGDTAASYYYEDGLEENATTSEDYRYVVGDTNFIPCP